MILIANPYAGKYSNEDIQRITKLLVARGLNVSLHITEGPGDATLQAKKAKGRNHGVVAIGGDGTMNEVINGLAGSHTPLGIIPAGTGNALAQGLGIPQDDISGAIEVILRQNRRRIDLGMINGRYFILVAGIGFDALVASKVKPEFKKRFGLAAYSFTAFKEIFKYNPTAITVSANGKVYQGTFVLVANCKNYGGTLSFAKKARMDDGLLDLLVFKSMDPVSALKYAWGASVGDISKFSDVVYLQTGAAHIESGEPVPVHLDAETYGTTPVDMSVCKSCLDVLIP